MADDNTRRSFRSNEPYRREAESLRTDDQGSDPLAELARLIGRNDPFAELGRSQPRQAAQPEPQHAGRDDWRHPPAREPNFGHDDFASREAQNSYQDTQPYQGSRRASARQADHEADRGSSYDPRYGSPQDYAPQYGAEGGRYDAYEDDRFQQDRYSYQEGGYDERHADDDGHQQGRHYDDGHDDDRRDGQEGDDYYEDDAPLAPHEDEMYDDAPRARRRGGLATALALTGCALLGTAGAYAYRSYSGPPSSMQSPPVITADSSTPTKIVPTSAADPQSTKAIQDRVATAGKEQIVPKQEEPVALREVGTQTPPRGVQPSPGGLGGVTTEPRRIKTERIRPDGNDISGRPVGTLPPAATPPAAPPPAATRSATAPKSAAAQPRNGGPVSLDPPAGEPPAPAAAPTRTAVRTAPESATTSGGFVVQLSSQKSEGEAQASFRTLQAKFPNELGGRQAIIRRADLGSKGVVYRAMVGPFASSQEASQFCTSYKAAGGQCFLPKE
jgi:SPOR domain